MSTEYPIHTDQLIILSEGGRNQRIALNMLSKDGYKSSVSPES